MRINIHSKSGNNPTLHCQHKGHSKPINLYLKVWIKLKVLMHATKVLVMRWALRLQDTLFGVLRKIATARSISVRFSSNFHQMFSSACKIW